MPAQIQRDDAVLQRELLQLIIPLFGLSPKAMDKNKRPLGMLGRNINRRKPHKRSGASGAMDQRICRNAHFMPIQVEIDVHEESLHEAVRDVNLRNKNLR